jgi:putative thioredoxin
VVQWLRKAVPSKYHAQLKGASQLVLEGRMAEARELLEHIVAAEADNERAAVLLAQTHLNTDQQQAVKAVESVNLGSESFEPAEAIRTLAGVFGRAETPVTLPDDPVRGLYLDAVAKARSNDFVAALDGFIEVVRKNRYYDDDGSRKACIAIFKLLGEDSQVTKEYRRALSNALY